jgi:hypothetical protein
MAGTISQRISLEGSDDIRKKLEELGKAGEKAFKQIQEAAAKPITDPAQVDKTRQAIDQLVASVQKLAPQFQQVNAETTKLGQTGPEAFSKTSQEANNLGVRIGVVAGVMSALTSTLLSTLNALRNALSPGDLLKGTTETGKAISDQAEKLGTTIPEWMKLSKAMTDAGVSQEDFIKGASGLAQKIAAANGGLAELLPGQFQSTAKGAAEVMRELAEQIKRLGNSAQAAKDGTAAFGKNWKEIVNALTGGKAAAAAADDIFDKLAKVDRALSPEQAEKAARLAKGWEVLGQAIRAAKDQMGSVFLDSALLRAEWLTKLVDASRELFRIWQQLAEAKKAAFLEGLGDSPAEQVFKTLIALGQQLSGLWNVLVSAGEKLAGMLGEISGNFEGVSKSQVAAFFITAATAALALTLALKGLGLLLTPLSLLLSLFSPFGAVLLAAGAAAMLFWDQISEGATKAAQLIPAELAQIGEAIKKLFAGDFSGFWDQFSAAAVSAFEKISQAAQETPWVKSLLEGINQIASEAPGAIQSVIAVISALGTAAETVANVINKIFGTELNATGVVLITILASVTGGLVALAAIAGTAAAAVSVLATAIGAIGAVVAVILGIPAAIGAVVVAIAALAAALLVINWDSITQAGVAAWEAITTAVGNLITKLGELAEAAGGAIWDAFASAGQAAIDLVMGAIDSLISKFAEAARWAGSLFGGGGGGEATEAPGNARGGLIGGRGTGTSDSNLSWVSRGEHIMPARAVRQPGMLAFLEALRRNGGNLRAVLDGMGRFASGGLVSMPAMANAGGGGSMRNLGTIDLRTNFGDATVMASPSAVEQLQRLGVTRRMTSTSGKKPGFIG